VPAFTAAPAAVDAHRVSCRPIHRPLPLALVCLAVLLLGFGLPHFLVRCTDHTGIARIEFVHTPGTCCDHGDGSLPHEDAATLAGEHEHERGEPRLAQLRHCEHDDLAVDVAPAPTPQSFPAAHDVPLCARLPILAELAAADPAAPRHPPATGPPRHDPGLLRLATTHLLL
jgi:hypothetical protein